MLAQRLTLLAALAASGLVSPVLAAPLLRPLAPSVPGPQCGDVTPIPAFPGDDAFDPIDFTLDSTALAGNSIGSGPAGNRAAVWTQATGVQLLNQGGFTLTFAAAISADGNVVVGHTRDAQDRDRPLRWTGAAAPEDLFQVASLSGFDGIASGMSDDGSVICGRLGDSSQPVSLQTSRAFVWTAAGGVQFLSPPGTDSGLALAVSADGSVVVGADRMQGGQFQPFRWTAATGVQPLPLPPGALGALPRYVSADGQIIVGSAKLGISQDTVIRWTPSGVTTLENALGTSSGPRGLSRDGSVLLATNSSPIGSQPVLWSEATGPTTIAPETLFAGPARALSADGSIAAIQAFQSAELHRFSPIGVEFCSEAVPNASGCPGQLIATGSRTVTDNALTLEASRLPQNVFGFFLVSPQTASIAQPGISFGVLCLGGPIGRYSALNQIRFSGPQGAFSLTLDLQSIPRPTGPVSATAGQTWMFQTWHRDLAATPASNFTRALAVTLN